MPTHCTLYKNMIKLENIYRSVPKIYSQWFKYSHHKFDVKLFAKAQAVATLVTVNPEYMVSCYTLGLMLVT